MKIPTTLHRSMRLEDVGRVKTRADHSEDEPLELEFAFASETPVERFFGFEELEVTPKAARLERVGQGVVPLISNHLSSEVIGRVLGVSISKGIARARVRFSRSDAARDAVRDVVDGIRQGISFGYRVHKMELIESGDDGDRFRVTDWELFEVTLASMPADPSVGIHRSSPDQNLEALVAEARRGHSGVQIMEPETPPNNPTTPGEILAAERKRVADIETIGREFTVSEEMTRAAVQKGTSVEHFLGEIRLERSKGGEPLSPPDTDLGLYRNPAADFQYGRRDEYGLDGHDTRGWSLWRALGALSSGRPEEAPLEFSISDHARNAEPDREYRRRGLTVPLQVLSGIVKRAVGKVNPNTSGAALVGTDHLGSAFIDFLRPRLAVASLGATILAGRVGDLSIPRQITSGVSGWVAENAGSGESTPTYDAITMSPKTIRARGDVTRRMLTQADPSSEMLLVLDLQNRIAQSVDLGAIAGSGTGAEPEGILNTSGIGSVTYDATSGQTERQSFIALQDAVAAADVDLTSGGLLVSTSMRARLQGLSVDAGSGVFVWQDGDDPNMGRVAGIRAAVTNNVPRNLGVGTNEHLIVFGNWSDLLIAMWSSVDIMTDEVTLGDSGGLVIRAFQDVDIAVRHPVSFAISQTIP